MPIEQHLPKNSEIRLGSSPLLYVENKCPHYIIGDIVSFSLTQRRNDAFSAFVFDRLCPIYEIVAIVELFSLRGQFIFMGTPWCSF